MLQQKIAYNVSSLLKEANESKIKKEQIIQIVPHPDGRFSMIYWVEE